MRYASYFLMYLFLLGSAATAQQSKSGLAPFLELGCEVAGTHLLAKGQAVFFLSCKKLPANHPNAAELNKTLPSLFVCQTAASVVDNQGTAIGVKSCAPLL
jgi:hypothetical protein